MIDAIRISKWTIDFKDEGLWNKMNWMVTRKLQRQLDLEVDC